MDGRCLERSVEGEKVPAQGEKLRWPVFSKPNFCSYSRLTQVQSLRQILFFQDIRTLSQYCLDVILKMHAITSGSRRQLLNHWNFVIFQMFQMLEIFQMLQMLQICKSSIVALYGNAAGLVSGLARARTCSGYQVARGTLLCNALLNVESLKLCMFQMLQVTRRTLLCDALLS